MEANNSKEKNDKNKTNTCMDDDVPVALEDIFKILLKKVESVENKCSIRIKLVQEKLSKMYEDRDEVDMRIRDELEAAINDIIIEFNAKWKTVETALFQRIENKNYNVTSNETRDYLSIRIKEEVVPEIKHISSEFNAKIKCVEDKLFPKDYDRKCNDFIGQLTHFYLKTQSCVAVAPMRTGNDFNLRDIYVKPRLCHVKLQPDGSWTNTNVPINKYKNLFYKGEQLNSIVFMQGESGSGKSTFLSKLVLDWCEALSGQTEDHTATFPDVETLQRFNFLFYIQLRDTKGQSGLVDIIKSQIIDRIYSDNEKREDAYRLLHQIMKRDTCMVLMDGLNEWTDNSNEIQLPNKETSQTQCVYLISTQPWKVLEILGKRITDFQIDALLEVEGISNPKELLKRILRSCQIDNLKIHTEFMTYIEERKLSHVLTSPLWLTLLLRLWMDKMCFSNSQCEVISIFLDNLFKKASTQTEFFNPPPFPCLSKTKYIKPHVNILHAISKAAFHSHARLKGPLCSASKKY